MTTFTNPTHAALSPSKRHRWGACPGSIREEAKYPEAPAGPAAADGTHTHTLLEHCVKAACADPTPMIGVAMKDHEGEFKVDAERAARVKVATDYLKKRAAEYDNHCTVLAETRVDASAVAGRNADLSGTVDVMVIGGDVLEIIDYKDGMAPVEALNNAQMEQYAIGALATLASGVATRVTTIRMTIVQPKLALRGLPAISSSEVSVQHLVDVVLPALRAQADATDDPNAPLVPGESQCKYCRAKGGCSALASQALSSMGMTFPVIGAAPLDVAQQSAGQDPNTMSADKIREIMDAAPLMRQLLDAVEDEALKRLKAGQSIPGLKLVNGRGSKSWSLPEDQMAEKLTKMGIPKGEVYVTKLLSPAQAVKVTWEKRDGTKMQLTERQIKTLDKEYIVHMAGKLTVAPESDSRQAVVMNAAPLFSAVEPPAEVPAWLS